MLAMESANSIHYLYRHFLSGITEKSLNSFYYAHSYIKVDDSGFMNMTASMALKLIPDSLKSQPIFFCIDDTMVSKYGKKLEDVSSSSTMLRIANLTVLTDTVLLASCFAASGKPKGILPVS